MRLFLIRNKSRNPIYLFPSLYSDRLIVNMGNWIMMMSVVFNYLLLLHLHDFVLHVRVYVSAKLMEHISSLTATEAKSRLPAM